VSESSTTPAVPAVVATCVVHAPGEWFSDTLASLRDQDYENLQCLFLVSGKESDERSQRILDQIGTYLPHAVVRFLGANTGFGAACNSVLELVEGSSGFFCFLHDDTALATDAIRCLVDELYRSNAGMVGPKLVEWSDPRTIHDVGTAIDRFGERAPYGEPGERDQEQHDHVQDVFVLNTAALLIRADLFRVIGGFRPNLTLVGDDLDLCWRVHVTGARVVIVPAAVARHRGSLADRVPADVIADLPMEAERERMRTVMSMTSLAYLPLVVVQLFFFSVAQAITSVVTGQPRRGFNTLRALMSLPLSLGVIAKRRKELSSYRAVKDSEVRALQMRGSARINAYLRRRSRLSGIADAQYSAQTGDKSVSRRSVFALWLTVIALLAIGSRSLFFDGVASVGQFVHFGAGARDIWSAVTSGWWSASFGHEIALPTGMWMVSLASVITFGKMELLRTLIIIGLPLIGYLGAWRFSSVYLVRSGRIAATVMYAAVPLPYAAIASGRWGALTTYALLPWVAHLLRQLIGHVTIDVTSAETDRDVFGDVSPRVFRRTAAQLLVVVAVAVAFEPGFILVVLGLAVTWSFTTLFHGASFRHSMRWLLYSLIAIGAAMVLHFPWTGSFIRSDWWNVVTGVGIDGGRGLGVWNILRFNVGEVVMSSIAVLLFIPAAVSVFIVRGARVGWALRGALLVVATITAVMLDDRALLPGHLPEPAVVLTLAALGMSVCAGALGASLSVDVRRGRLSWRQPLGILASLAFVVGLVPSAINVIDGRFQQVDASLTESLATLPDASQAGQYRTLYLGDARVVPGSPMHLGWGVAYTVTAGVEPRLEDGWEPTRTRATDQLELALRGIVRGQTARAGRLLAPLSIRYLVVPIVDGAVSTRSNVIDPPEGLVSALTDQLDLRRRYSSPDVVIFENAAWITTRSLLTEAGAEASRSAGAASVIGADLTGATPLLQTTYDHETATGNAPIGTFHLSVPYSDGWTLMTSEGEIIARPAFGVTTAYDIPDEGPVSLEFETSALHRFSLGFQAVLWVIVLLFALVRRPRRFASGQTVDYSNDTAVVMTESGTTS
jgi:GT2 family glycosyltransferase